MDTLSRSARWAHLVDQRKATNKILRERKDPECEMESEALLEGPGEGALAEANGRLEVARNMASKG